MSFVKDTYADRDRWLDGDTTVHMAPIVVDEAGSEHTVLLPRIFTDPVDELVERVRLQLEGAVDALQVAAVLEANGHTDRAAQVEYGYRDVFALASEVYRRMGPSASADAEAPVAPRTAARWRDDLRLISHGLLYAMPGAAFPAVMAVVGLPGLVLGLVLAGTLGWIASGVAAYAAYRLLGLGRPRSASRVLRAAMLTVPLLCASLLGALLAAAVLPRAVLPLAALIVAQLAYQMASTLLIFYRRELWLAVVMLPAVGFGAFYLVSGGTPHRTWAVAAAAASVLVACCAALWAPRRAAGTEEPAKRDPLWPPMRALIGVAGYGLCAAALLFHAQAPYLLSRLDIATAAAPLVLSMGLVEWRTSRFRPHAVALTRRARRPDEFVPAVWRRIARELATCLVAPVVLGAAMLAGLSYLGMLSAAGVVMTAAHVALAGAYYLAFLLVGRGRYGWLCLSIAIAIALHVGVGALLGVAPLAGQHGSALADTALYLGSVLLLQALFALGLRPVIGQIRHYR